jgi:membrane peptidoglycan carboxypeptidase
MSALKRPNGRLGAVLGFVGISVIAGVLASVAVTPAIALTGLAANNSIGMFENLPSYVKIGDLPEKTTIYGHRTVDGADQSVPIASFYAENRESVTWDQVSQSAKDAAVAAEDPRFYEHGGIDPIGVVRAAVSNVLGSNVQGASTITQQYVKNVLVAQATGLATEKEQAAAYQEATKVSFDRKLKEMRLAIGMEKAYSKDDILLGYLNIALFGGRVYGIQTASQYYYGINAADLTLPQAASLLAIVNNPEKFRLDKPDSETNGAANGYAANKARRDYILGNLLKEKKITKEEHDAAVATPIEPKITPAASGCTMAGNAGFFCDYVVNVIRNDPVFGKTAEQRYSAFIRGGYDVYTTLDLDLQDTAQAAIDKNVPKSADSVDIASAATSVEAGTGKIKLMAENKDFNNSGNAADQGPNFSAINYSTNSAYGGSAGFQAASTYKVFTLIAWLRAGHSLGETLNISERTWDLSSFKACDNSFAGSWEPGNDENESGTRTVLQATSRSINGGFVGMGQKLDQCDIRKAATDLGVTNAAGKAPNDNPGAILGDTSVSPLTMAAAYAGIANDGVYCAPIAIERMVNQDGSDRAIPTSDCHQAIEPDIAAATQYALSSVITGGGTAVASNPNDGIEHFAKTGTSDFAHQTWTTGASSKASLSVLVGQATGEVNLRKISFKSGQVAALRHKIWRPIMSALDDKLGGDDFPKPDSKYIRGVFVTVPKITGMTVDRAQAALEAAGFKFEDGGTQPSSAPRGQVIGSDPAGGSSASRGATVTVYTSDGSVEDKPEPTPSDTTEVPDVVGQKAPAATSALNDAGYSKIKYALDTKADADSCTVTSTNPAGGTEAPTDTTVTVTIAGSNRGNGNGNGGFDINGCS